MPTESKIELDPKDEENELLYYKMRYIKQTIVTLIFSTMQMDKNILQK
jgi:hypothetical protein